jgi:chondroitin polymerizing factor/chondroitin polymerizing factor 2
MLNLEKKKNWSANVVPLFSPIIRLLHVLLSCPGADRLDIQEVVKVTVERLNVKYNNIYLYLKLNNGYRRFDPQRGMEYILDITLRDTSNENREVQKRVQLVRPLGQVGYLTC